jgi:hypothetical protein
MIIPYNPLRLDLWEAYTKDLLVELPVMVSRHYKPYLKIVRSLLIDYN